MTSSGHVQFSRRMLLKAAGATLTVPFFLKQAFAQTAGGPPNLVLMMATSGVNQSSFWPTATSFTSPQLAKLLTDPTVGPKTTVIRGVNLKKTGNPAGNGHDWGWHGLYSGHDNVTSGGAQSGGGPSVDQLLLKKPGLLTAPFKHIHCGVHAADYRLINAGRISFSCSAKGQLVPCELNIYSLYTKIFGALVPATGTGTDEAAAAAARRLAQRKSVLDTVAKDLQALQGRLGPREREKVATHLEAVRDFEKRLSTNINTGGGMRPAACSTAKPSQLGVPSTGQGNEANADKLFRLFMEFIANAVACNMVGVLTFQFGRGGEHFHYKWLNIPGMRADFHDEIAHRDRDDGSDPVATSVMIERGKYYTDLVTDLGKRLATFPQADGKTALDNSLVVWGNEVATGPHGINNLPLVFMGGAAGRLKRTGYLVNPGTQNHHRLGCTIQNIMGDPVAGFGADPACGMLQGLEVVPPAA